ncbi:hypothetical protein PI126_g4682 [Phytophthora idaei]|nr:hypothetical protein PI126_g4682 [Phytophthora idaei]
MEIRALSSSSAGQERLFRPKESVAQYEDDFKRWLGARGVTVKSLESRPEVEQLFRHDFTALKAWELQQSRAAQQSCKLDASSDSEEEGEVREDWVEQAFLQCESCARKTPPGDLLRQPEQYQRIRRRCELLRTEVMSVDDFNWRIKQYGPNGYMDPREMLSPVAIVLRPGETVEKYEEVFQKWLRHKKMTLQILLNHPEEERRYRQCYAYSRVRTHMKIQDKQTSRRRSRSPSRIHTSSSKWAKFDSTRRPYKKCRDDPRDKSPRDHLPKDIRLDDFKRRGNYHTESVVPSKKSSEEMAYLFFEELGRGLCNGPGATTGDQVLTPSTCAPETPKSTFSENGDTFPAAQMDALSATDTAVLIPPAHEDNLLAVIQQHRVVEADAEAQTLRQTEEPIVGSASVDLVPDSLALLNAAAEILARVERISTDLAKTRLVERYIRFTDQIVVNETAISDVLAHVAKINDNSEGEETEIIDQVEEAIMTVNEVKMQRDKALADAMAHEWSGKEVELDKQPQLHVEMQMPEAGTHQELALLYGELLRNDKEVQDFQSKLKTCLDAVDGKVTTHDAQIDDVARLVRELSAKLTGKTQLKSQCDALSIELLRCVRPRVS